jgi:hypothetical protein
MSVSTHPAKTSRHKAVRLLPLTVAAAAVIALAAWAITASVTGSASNPRQAVTLPPSGPVVTPRQEREFVEGLAGMALAQLNAQPAAATQASGPTSVSREERRFVEGLAAMTLAQLSAAFGTGHTLMSSSPLSSMTPTELQRNDAVLASLTPKERRYVGAIESTSYAQLAAAFGTGR